MAKPIDPGQPGSVAEQPFFTSLIHALTEHWDKPALIIVTGDITTRASPHEFIQAESFMLRLKKAWGEPPIALLMVPGNHDVSWDISALDEKSNRWFKGMRFAPYLLSALRESFDTHTTHNLNPGESPNIVHTLFLSNPSIAVAGINSAMEEDHNVQQHHGYISDKQIEIIKDKLSATNATIRILALHHHLRPLRDPPKWRDYSTALNAQALTDALGEIKIDLVLHGHKHRPNYDLHIAPNTWHTHIFCAGSLATIPQERDGGDVRCSAHLIRIKGRDQGVLYGEIATLKMHGAADSYNWRLTNDGYPPIKRFGRALAPDALPQAINDVLKSGNPVGAIGKLLVATPHLYGVTPEAIRTELQQQLAQRRMVLADANDELELWKAYRAP